MGSVIVHNRDDEPVVLQGALVLVWAELEQPRTEEEVCEALTDVAGEAGLRQHVVDALVALEAVGLVSGSA